MSDGPDPLSMLDVIEESRQQAMAQRETAVEMLAAFALKAIVEGHDIRDVAERCGFECSRPESTREAQENARSGLFTASYMRMMMFGESEAPRRSIEEGFADWVCEALKKRIAEALS